MHDTTPDHERLFQIASEHGGYFTAAQARDCGFSSALLGHHAREGGRLIRVRRGLYRLRRYPSSPREDVLAAWLAAGPDQAVVSHESALEILGLSDVVPDAVHITVPRSRRYRPRVAGARLHTTTRELPPSDVTVRDGIRLTSAVRSIVDAAEAGVAPEQVQAATRDALDRGMATERRLVEAARRRGRRVEQLIRRSIQERRGR